MFLSNVPNPKAFLSLYILNILSLNIHVSVQEYAYSVQSVESYLYVFFFIVKQLVNSIFANDAKVSTSLLHLYPAKDQPSICA